DAILADPPPVVLVEALGSATVTLSAHFWIDGRVHSLLRVRSAALRLMKRTLVERGMSMPDEAREIIFPQGVPLLGAGEAPSAVLPAAPSTAAPAQPGAEPAAESTAAEGGLGNEIAGMPTQVSDATIPEAAAENLLRK